MKTAVDIIDTYAHTNDCPSAVDHAHISRLISEENLCLASVDNTISQLRAQLSDLRVLRRKQVKTLQQLRAITSPLRLLPPEILSLIFLQCLPSDEREHDLRNPRDRRVLQNPSPNTTPLLLVRICSRWRHIALATPMLWSRLELRLPDLLPEEGESWQMVLLNNWIVNASPFPISLAVRCTSSEILKRALSTSCRFRALYLDLSGGSSIHALGLRRAHPALHVDVGKLQVIVKGHRHDVYRQGAAYSVFENSPSLRNFTLISSSSAQDPVLLKFVLPWAQLTHLCIEEPLFFVSMTVLLRCINLARCTFGTMEPFDDEEDVALQQCTTFPFLSEAHFSFGLLDSHTADNFLAPLILPALKKLVIQSFFNGMEWSTAAFDSFQLRSAFLLEELELHRITLQSEELHDLLESLSTLKALTLSDVGNAAQVVSFFRLITWDPSDPLLPHLKQLKTGFIQADTSLEPCIAMVRSRRKRPRAVADGTPTASRLERLHFVSYKATSSLDRWWWPWKFERLFPKMELKFECTDLR